MCMCVYIYIYRGDPNGARKVARPLRTQWLVNSVLYYIALCCILLYVIGLYCVVLYDIILYCIILYDIMLYHMITAARVFEGLFS